jgi:predicted O-methyltransferase YrrM
MSADWLPYSVLGVAEADLAVLRSPDLAQLEAEVIKHLKDSWCSEQKARLLLELVVITRPGVCVEIGAFSGSTTLPMLAGLRYLESGRAYVVEPWSNAEAVRGLPADDVNTSWWSDVDMAAVRSQFDRMLVSWSLAPRCEVLVVPSRDAISAVPAIDLLHLDGNFSQEGAALDSDLYLPKVISGGHVVLSNVLVTVAETPTKMSALSPLFDACDILGEVDGGNTLLFRKR